LMAASGDFDITWLRPSLVTRVPSFLTTTRKGIPDCDIYGYFGTLELLDRATRVDERLIPIPRRRGHLNSS